MPLAWCDSELSTSPPLKKRKVVNSHSHLNFMICIGDLLDVPNNNASENMHAAAVSLFGNSFPPRRTRTIRLFNLMGGCPIPLNAQNVLFHGA
uniref:Uncharacterized protein n=1 Tax=Panagrellus redivivus TaxID=6233 RepID=A0A7E4UVZ9_PANRE